MRRAHLVPDGLALLLVRELLLLDEGALGDGDGPALGLHDQLALLLVLGLADLVGDPLARPVLFVPAFRVLVGGLALLLPDIVVDDVAAVLTAVPGLVLRFPGLFLLVILVLLVFLKVARGRGGEDQEGEDGQGLHVVGRSVNVGIPM